MAWVLDLSLLVGGFLLAAVLLQQIPQIARGVESAASTLNRFRLVVAVVALVAAGYFLIVHAVSGPQVLHFEVVGLLVGICLLLTSTPASASGAPRTSSSGRRAVSGPTNVTQDPRALLLAVLGLIAIIVGLQGLITPN